MKMTLNELAHAESRCAARRAHDKISTVSAKPLYYRRVAAVKDIIHAALFHVGDFAPDASGKIDIDAGVEKGVNKLKAHFMTPKEETAIRDSVAEVLAGKKTQEELVKDNGLVGIPYNPAIFLDPATAADKFVAVVKESKEKGLGYINDTQEKQELEDEKARLTRFLKWEKRTPAVAPYLEVPVFDIEVAIKPDYMIVNSEGIEVIVVRDRKPDTLKSVKHELYAMLKYGEAFAPKGKFVPVKATYLYLVRKDDRIGGLQPVFTEIDGKSNPKNPKRLGDNILSMLVPDAASMAKLDAEFQPVYKAIYEGQLCDEADCKGCDFEKICNAKIAPKYIVKTKKKVSLRQMMSGLSDAQTEAVQAHDGIFVINACAGSGKTFVICLRVAMMLYQSVTPESILLITFTDNAAKEMKERISLYVADLGVKADVDKVQVKTYNAFYMDKVKENYLKLGYTEVPGVIDAIDATAIIASVLEGTNIPGLRYRSINTDTYNYKGALTVAKDAFEIIKRYQLSLGDEETLAEKLGPNTMAFATMDSLTELIKLYNKYDSLLKANNLIEFADQQWLFDQMLKNDPYYVESFKIEHVIVDEFQDSDEYQINFLKQLIDTPSFKDLMVVGDDSQAIYGFRDTSPDFIINFDKWIGQPCHHIMLLENYRSTGAILELANKVNALNVHRVVKDLVPVREYGKKPTITGFYSKDDEYRAIVEGIEKKIAAGTKLEDMAVICRRNDDLADIGELLTKKGIQWVSLNPMPYLESVSVQAAIALSRVFTDKSDTKDALVYLNGLFKGELFKYMNDDEVNELIGEVQAEAEAASHLDDNAKQLRFHELADVVDTDDELYADFLDRIRRRKGFKAEAKYLSDFAVYGKNEAFKRCRDYPGVVLTTCHSSKGLEWPIVFLSVSKFHKKGMKYEDMEEERRLLFVSITRARDELFITGQYEAYRNKTSGPVFNRFLEELYDITGQDYEPIDVNAAKRKEEKKKLIAAEADERRAKRKAELEAKGLDTEPKTPSIDECLAFGLDGGDDGVPFEEV